MEIQQTQQPNVAPAPISPEEAPGMQPEGGNQEEMRQTLGEMMEKIDSKYNDFNTQNSIVKASGMENKSFALQQVFDLFKKMGVDPSNVEEVGAFLNKIKEGNPELFEQISKALESLISEDEPGVSEQGMENKEETPPQMNDVMGAPQM